MPTGSLMGSSRSARSCRSPHPVIDAMPLGTAIGAFAAAAYLTMAAAAFLLPETRGKVLTA